MTFSSPLFYLFLLSTTLSFHAVQSPAARQTVILAASVLFIRSFAASWLDMLPLAFYVGVGFILVRLAHAFKSTVLSVACIACYVAVFIYLKRITTFGIGPLGFDYAVIGMSYILFRTLHLVMDVSNGELEQPPSLWMYLLYTLNLFCFVSGPIQLWQDFEKAKWSGSAYLTQDYVFQCFARMIWGLFKLAVIAATANYMFANVDVQLRDPASMSVSMLVLRYCVAALAYAAYLYYNFSGYMDIVIAAGRLMGQVVPENFDRPFSSTSFLEFWQRWHMTLSSWFKSYVFTPLIIALMRMSPLAALPTITGMLCFFVTFLLMGVWHGTTEVFVVYGLLMGLGASVNKGWSILLQRATGRIAYRKLVANSTYAAAARGTTFSYFTLALTCLWIGDLAQLTHLASRLAVFGIAEAFIIMAVGFGLAYAAFRFVQRFVVYIVPAMPRSIARGNYVLASQIVIVVLVLGLMSRTPDFVYGAY